MVIKSVIYKLSISLKVTTGTSPVDGDFCMKKGYNN